MVKSLPRWLYALGLLAKACAWLVARGKGILEVDSRICCHRLGLLRQIALGSINDWYRASQPELFQSIFAWIVKPGKVVYAVPIPYC